MNQNTKIMYKVEYWYINGQWVARWKQTQALPMGQLTPRLEPRKPITAEEAEEINKIIKRMKEEGLIPKLEE